MALVGTPRAVRAGAAFALALSLVASPRSAGASEGPGASKLDEARAASTREDFGAAERGFREAIEAGGLDPGELVESYAGLGVARLRLGKKKPALAAFRAAAVLDPSFAVPNAGGPKAMTLAAQARRDTAKLGTLRLGAELPTRVPGGAPFTIVATLDPAHVAAVRAIGASVEGGGAPLTERRPSAQRVEFEVPAATAKAGATLKVRLDALDGKDNRVAVLEDRIVVDAEPSKVASATSAAKPSSGAPSKALLHDEAPARDERRGGGFWSSPWTYVVAGVLLAGAGVAAYALTRPPDTITLEAVTVGAR